MTKWILFVISAAIYLPGYAQYKKAATEAFTITRMVQKFHYQPKPLNDSFSARVFTNFIQQTDEHKQFYTSGDIAQLTVYKYLLDEEIQQQRTAFLELATTILGKRLQQADSTAKAVGMQPFNFYTQEKIALQEIQQWPADSKAMQTKVYKSLKSFALDHLLKSKTGLALLTPAQLKLYADSIEPASRKKAVSVFRRSITRLLQSLGGIGQYVANTYCNSIAEAFDPHTSYLPIAEKENFEADLGKTKPVFGFNMNENNKGETVINELLPGSAAFKSGQFNKGDKILGVQWEGKDQMDVSDAGVQEISNVLDASNHDKAVFTIEKPDGTLRKVPLIKELASDQEDEKVKSFVLKGKKTIGYISLPAFYEDWEDTDIRRNGCANDVARAIVKLKKENIDGLVIDVRYNGGGSVMEAIELIGIFIDGGPVAQVKTNDAKILSLKDGNRGTIYDGPLVVMVNGYSASASEMLAGTLQDYNRAVIVGTPTYGKATAQAIFPMDTTVNADEDFSRKTAASYLKITTAQLYRISGATAQAFGVVPDVVLPDLLQADGAREEDNPTAIKANRIEANKYYKPLAPMPGASIATAAEKAAAENRYFNQVSQYTAQVLRNREEREISLNLPATIQAAKTSGELTTPEASVVQPVFSVNNVALDADRIKADKKVDEMTAYWREFLQKDPYVQVTYQVLLSIIK